MADPTSPAKPEQSERRSGSTLESKHFREVVENANEMILVAQDGELRYFNPKFAAVMGYAAGELEAVPFTELIHPEDRQLVYERHQQRVRGEIDPESTYRFRVLTKAGEVRRVELKTAVLDWDGRPATVNFLSDVTERERLENELVRAQKLDSLGVLAGGLAHDFNNLLTVILGNLSLLGLGGGDQETPLEDAERAALKAKELTQQLLTFSRGGAPRRQVVELADLVQETVEFSLRGSSVRADFELAPDLGPAEVDPGQLGQVFHNLVMNAVEAMPGGGVLQLAGERVTVESGNALALPAGEFCRVAISDSGIGISDEHLERVFDPFFTTKQDGNGLGLAMVYSIVKRHGGSVTVQSVRGEGSTFVVHLPVAPAAAVAMAEARSQDRTPKPRRARILVMDDEQPILTFCQRALRLDEHAVDTAADGAAAIELYRRALTAGKPYDLVILDLTVPGGMGGEAVIARLLEIDPEVRAIVSSGYSNSPVMARFRDHGFEAAVEKPYTVEELRVAVRLVLSA